MVTKIIPGVYVSYTPQKYISNALNKGGVVGIVGDFVLGEINTPIEIKSFEDFENKLGGLGTQDSKNLYSLLLQQPKKVIAVRVVGEGAQKAQAVLQDASSTDLLKIEALYYGSYGNDITVSVSNGTLTVSYLDQNESYQITDLDSLVSNINTASSLVSAQKLADGTLEDTTVSLAGGSNGNLSDSHYIGGYDATTDSRYGLAVLELVPDVEIVVLGGAPSATKNNALIEHAIEFKRLAVMSTLTPSNLPSFMTEVTSYYDDNGVAVVAFPAVKILIDGTEEEINPAYVLAGALGRIDPNEPLVNVPVYGATDVSRDLTTSEIESLISARVNPITLKGDAYVFRHNLTTAENDWKDINVRRIFNLIGRNADDILDQFIGQPNTSELWGNIANSLSNYLQQLVLSGWIADYRVVVDASNNPPELREQGIVKAKLLVKPVYSTYYFEVQVEKALRFETRR